MDVDAFDRELMIERAEAVRFWLLGLHVSNRATGAIQRELRRSSTMILAATSLYAPLRQMGKASSR
jgi:hypothetical protein